MIKLRRCSSLRESYLSALDSNDFERRRDALAATNFSTTGPLLAPDEIKYAAFHLSQSLALMKGRELFTKKSLCAAFDNKINHLLYPLEKTELYSSQDFLALEMLKREFVEATRRARCSRLSGTTAQLFYHSSTVGADNLFLLQCCGHVVDIAQERVLHWGLQPPLNPDLPQPDWGSAPLAPSDGINGVLNVVIESGEIHLAAADSWVSPKQTLHLVSLVPAVKQLIAASQNWYIVLHFTEEGGLFLFGARHRLSGVCATPPQLGAISKAIGLRLDS